MTASKTHSGMDRRKFVARLLAQTPDALVVTGLGSASYDVFAAGDRDHNYYLWGAMGGASSVGLGMALAQKDRPVVVITGDGEQMMGIGSLATISARSPCNLTIVVLDNGHYGETGMQKSHSSLGTDLAAVAKGFGVKQVLTLDTLEQADGLASTICSKKAATFVQALVHADEPPRALPPRDGPFIKNRFRTALGLAPF